jgi:hypothetical protein
MISIAITKQRHKIIMINRRRTLSPFAPKANKKYKELESKNKQKLEKMKE